MSEVDAAVEALVGARAAHRRLARLPDGAAPGDAAAAYAIQDAAAPEILRRAGGGTVVGYKIGCTNATAQAQLGVTEPFRGWLLSTFVHDSPASLPAAAFHMRQLEPEIAFRIGRSLGPDGAPYDAAAMRGAVAAAMPAIEVVDSRYADWLTVGALHLIADNGSTGHWVHGSERTDLHGLDFAAIAVAIAVNGREADRGRGANVLGGPLNALAWLANHLAAAGQSLEAGMLVSTGTCTRTVPVGAGDSAVARFDGLGEVRVRFD